MHNINGNEQATEATPTMDSAKKTVILAIDDRPDNLFVLSELIEEHLPEIDIKTASDSEKGMEIISQYPPGGILLDVQMPGTNGIEMCRKLKQNPKTSHIPVILITAFNTSSKIRAEGLEAGADDFISKPIDNSELVAKIKVMMRVKNSEDKLKEANIRLENLLLEKSQALEESRENYRLLVENQTDLIVKTDTEGKLLFASPSYCDTFNKTREELLNKSFLPLIHEDDRDRVAKEYNTVFKPPHSVYLEERVKTKDGWRWQGWQNTAVLDNNKQVNAVVCVGRDITERKETEAQLEKSLREKEALLSEIHHRVKNNLQVVSSLLSLQADQMEDKKAIEAFNECKNRIYSMALVHEQMYRSHDFSKIDIKDYAENMVSLLFRAYRPSATVSLEIDIDEVSMTIEKAVPTGLIITELVSNSLKHAFAGQSEGLIRVAGKQEENDSYCFIIEDDGIGMPRDIDFRHSESLGLKLVTILAQQIEAGITTEKGSRGGTLFKMEMGKIGE
ncbi:MAG: response regulator [bacterium]|nr:response regulator [bacterium]